MQYDDSKIDEAVLALLAVFSFDDGRSWKGYDFEVMDRLHAQGYIWEPRGKAKSVQLSEEGLKRGLELARELFSAKPPKTD